jgi:hypothetical protein
MKRREVCPTCEGKGEVEMVTKYAVCRIRLRENSKLMGCMPNFISCERIYEIDEKTFKELYKKFGGEA